MLKSSRFSGCAKNQILPDSVDRALNSKEVQSKLMEVQTKVVESYRDALRDSGFWKRLVLKMKMQRAIQKAKQKVVPSQWSI